MTKSLKYYQNITQELKQCFIFIILIFIIVAYFLFLFTGLKQVGCPYKIFSRFQNLTFYTLPSIT